MIRDHVRKRRSRTSVQADQHGHRPRRSQPSRRPEAFARQASGQRHIIKRCMNRREQWRGIDTCYAKTGTSRPAGLPVASPPPDPLGDPAESP